MFGSHINRHRDTATRAILASTLASGQLPTSYPTRTPAEFRTGTMVLTLGDMPMRCSLAFPPPGKPDAPREDYIIHPLFQIKLEFGTLFLLGTPNLDLQRRRESAPLIRSRLPCSNRLAG